MIESDCATQLAQLLPEMNYIVLVKRECNAVANELGGRPYDSLVRSHACVCVVDLISSNCINPLSS